MVSVLLAGNRRRSYSSEIVSVWACQLVARRLAPTEMVICLS